MRIFKKEIDLKLDNPSYLWQVVDGDGQTWVILRHKMQLPNENITELGELILEDTACDLLEVADEKALYRGKLKLRAYYKCKSNYELELAYPEAVHDEHQAREQLASSKECPLCLEQSEVQSEAGSIFLSKIYEELGAVPSVDTSEMSVWQLEMPWQALLENGELIGQPEIVVAHLGQIGIRTLLCEVLINLRAQEKQELSSKTLGANSFLAGEEVIFNYTQGRIDTILGSAIRRAFYQIKPGNHKTLDLEYLTKVNLVYISADLGGERILSACGLVPESLSLPMHTRPVLAPFIVQLKTEKVTLVKTNEKKVILKDQFVITLGEGVQGRKSDRITPSELEEPIAGKPLTGIPEKVAFIRPRPGEKWLKKSESPNSSYSQKKVLAIKFNTR